jgi:hypothetical protein
MSETNKVAYEGLDKINELKKSYIADMMSPDPETREKVNEIIRKVNLIIDILNGHIR